MLKRNKRQGKFSRGQHRAYEKYRTVKVLSGRTRLKRNKSQGKFSPTGRTETRGKHATGKIFSHGQNSG